MEDLAWQFPAEAVERAAVRFCEAIARWRGKPELETYKTASWIIGSKDQQRNGNGANGSTSSAAPAAMSIESLVHSNPTSPSNSNAISTPVSARPPESARRRRPQIDHYFTPPPSFALSGRKRRRDDADRGEARPAPMPPTYG